MAVRKIFSRKPGSPASATDMVLTLPEAEAEFVRQTYAGASMILEYGSGGSTFEAARLGKPVLSVESDAKWANDMNRILREGGYADHVRVVHEDIGKTGKWGRPRNDEGFAKYHRYSLSVWDDPDFVQPDVILIDGRFRVACFCAVIMRCKQPATVMVDDYTDRPHYHKIERLLKPREFIGRMAVFDVVPDLPYKPELTWMAGSFVSPD